VLIFFRLLFCLRVPSMQAPLSHFPLGFPREWSLPDCSPTITFRRLLSPFFRPFHSVTPFGPPFFSPPPTRVQHSAAPLMAFTFGGSRGLPQPPPPILVPNLGGIPSPPHAQTVRFSCVSFSLTSPPTSSLPAASNVFHVLCFFPSPSWRFCSLSLPPFRPNPLGASVF